LEEKGRRLGSLNPEFKTQRPEPENPIPKTPIPKQSTLTIKPQTHLQDLGKGVPAKGVPANILLKAKSIFETRY